MLNFFLSFYFPLQKPLFWLNLFHQRAKVVEKIRKSCCILRCLLGWQKSQERRCLCRRSVGLSDCEIIRTAHSCVMKVSSSHCFSFPPFGLCHLELHAYSLA
ncbi:hypothetical protein V8G54_030746 [Vigna mungo]|uniref:Uncharacterized protein n=1 Tax=Vigna mungo TaxID=3915 RepID=A0AAQ3MXB6_VIGMU